MKLCKFTYLSLVYIGFKRGAMFKQKCSRGSNVVCKGSKPMNCGTDPETFAGRLTKGMTLMDSPLF